MYASGSLIHFESCVAVSICMIESQFVLLSAKLLIEDAGAHTSDTPRRTLFRPSGVTACPGSDEPPFTLSTRSSSGSGSDCGSTSGSGPGSVNTSSALVDRSSTSGSGPGSVWDTVSCSNSGSRSSSETGLAFEGLPTMGNVFPPPLSPSTTAAPFAAGSWNALTVASFLDASCSFARRIFFFITM